MKLRISGKAETVEEANLTVSTLLNVKNVPDPDMVSVQLNGEIVDRDKFTSQAINEGDELEFLYFMGGGSSPLSPSPFCLSAADSTDPSSRQL